MNTTKRPTEHPPPDHEARLVTSFEVVLPSGAFAAVRTILVADMVAFGGLSGIAAMAVLAQRCATIDGRTLSPEEFLTLPYGEAQPIFEALNAQLRAAYATRHGVA